MRCSKQEELVSSVTSQLGYSPNETWGVCIWNSDAWRHDDLLLQWFNFVTRCSVILSFFLSTNIYLLVKLGVFLKLLGVYV